MGKRLLIIDPAFSEGEGHHLAANVLLTRTAHEAGFDSVRILCRNSCPLPAIADGLGETEPTFDSTPYAAFRVGDLPRLAALNRKAQEDFDAIPADMVRDGDELLVHTVNEVQFTALTRWLAQMLETRDIRVRLALMFPVGLEFSEDGVTGVRASELVMVSGVSHGTQPDDGWSAPDGVHTRVSLAQPGLRYRYRRTSVTVHGNVAHATHGESRAEVLGSGDAARRMQQFELKQHPLTFVSATTTSGIASTLGVRVNGLRWREAPNAAAVTADERAYLVTAEGGEPTTVVTGLGARLPTGRDNVRATYRSGLGRTGNVRAGQISVLGSQPAGVTGVTNLLATTGGADPDDLDRVRELAAIGLSALDRLVSASDLEDFARRFAGIGKAQIWQLDADTLVLSIAGVHDVPIAPGSALLRNLSGAIAVAGDLEQTAVDELMTRNLPSCRIVIRTRAARLIALRARVRLHPDHAWPDVQPRLRAALGRELGFDARRLGQVLDPSAVVAVMQRVRGVVAVDLQGLGTIDTDAASETADPVASIADQALAALSEPADGRMPPVSAIPDGAIAYWSPDASGTLLLSAWEEE